MAIGCATMGLFSIYLAVCNYLADTYQIYASSALAAQSFCTLPFLRPQSAGWKTDMHQVAICLQEFFH